ncbi:hypothetical protein VYU27_010552, partial [Nannochloropsis oceanica]
MHTIHNYSLPPSLRRTCYLILVRRPHSILHAWAELCSSICGLEWHDFFDEAMRLANSHCLEAVIEEAFTSLNTHAQSLISHWHAHGHDVPISYCLSTQGESRIFFNEPYNHRFLPHVAEARNQQELPVPFYIWSRVIAPEDQALFVTAVTETLFGLPLGREGGREGGRGEGGEEGG